MESLVERLKIASLYLRLARKEKKYGSQYFPFSTLGEFYHEQAARILQYLTIPNAK